VIKPIGIVHPPLDRGLAMDLTPRAGPFDFVSIFEWGGHHKNPRALLKAYCLAFSSFDPVRLVIKTGGSEEAIRADVQEVLREHRDPPEINIHVGSMTRAETIKLLEQSSCYVSTHRGEGWGLPIFEAMAMGLPAIATAFGAPLEFMDSESSYLVDYEYDSDMGHAEVDVAALAQAMLDVFQHQDEAKDRALEAQSKLVTRFTRAHTEQQIVNAVHALARGSGPVRMSSALV
jgi:glycosyltransferase involved in cell wall biosynthesis